jgi:hypothetical protein
MPPDLAARQTAAMSLGQVIGDYLGSAIGVAISPVPIIAAVLMVLSANAKRIAPAFAAGWLIGLALVTTVVTLLGDPAHEGS